MLLVPVPSAAQVLPFHLAIWLALTPPAVVKSPPAYRSLPETASERLAGDEARAADLGRALHVDEVERKAEVEVGFAALEPAVPPELAV